MNPGRALIQLGEGLGVLALTKGQHAEREWAAAREENLARFRQRQAIDLQTAQFAHTDAAAAERRAFDTEEGEKQRTFTADENRRERASRERISSRTGREHAPSGFRFQPDGSLAPITGGPYDPSGPNKPKTDFSRADKLRDEYNTASKDFITVADNYSAIRQVASDNSAAGDLSLVFSYMKMLDPGSVVREQEFANAQNAAGVPDRVRAAYNRVVNGERLAPNQRADFLKQAGNLFTSKQQRHDSTVKSRYTDMAQRWGLNPEDVISDLSMAPPAPGKRRGVSTPAAATATDAVQVGSIEEAKRLPSGTRFIGPDGQVRVRH